MGYLVIVASTRAKTRTTFLLLDIAGMVPVVIHYIMLGRPVGAALSGFYIAIDAMAAALHHKPSRSLRLAYLANYPIAIALLAWLWTDWRDLAAFLGTILAVEARRHSTLALIKLLVAISSAGWLVYGVFSQSIAQVVFSAVYGVMALLAARRDRLARPLND